MYVYGIGFLAIVAVAYGAVLPHNEPVPILRQDSEVNPDGSFTNNFETGNGIVLNEQAVVVKSASRSKDDYATSVTGRASWTAPDGTPIELSWVADENGARFTGAHLPVAPPAPEIPPAIQRSLEWIAAHPYVEPTRKH